MNIITCSVLIMSKLFDDWYLKNESVINLVAITIIADLTMIVSLLEYRNFSFEATLVM